AAAAALRSSVEVTGRIATASAVLDPAGGRAVARTRVLNTRSGPTPRRSPRTRAASPPNTSEARPQVCTAGGTRPSGTAAIAGVAAAARRPPRPARPLFLLTGDECIGGVAEYGGGRTR